jgi:hypothetical protein
MALDHPPLPVMLDILDRAQQHQTALTQSPEGLFQAAQTMQTGLSDEALRLGIQDHLHPEQALTVATPVAAYDFGWDRPRTMVEQQRRLNERFSSPWKRFTYWLTSTPEWEDNPSGGLVATLLSLVGSLSASLALVGLLHISLWWIILFFGASVLGCVKLYETVCYGIHNRCWQVDEFTDIEPKEIRQLTRHEVVRQYVRACLTSEVPFILREDHKRILDLQHEATQTAEVENRRQQWAQSFVHDPTPCERVRLDLES